MTRAKSFLEVDHAARGCCAAPPYGAGPGTEPDNGTTPDQECEIGVAPGGGTTTRPEGERPPPGPPCSQDSSRRPSGEALIADAFLVLRGSGPLGQLTRIS